MSRNLSNKTCVHCDHEVTLLSEVKRGLAEFRPGSCYCAEYADRYFAEAECPACLAQYLAWCVVPAPGLTEVRDLSYRSTFNDEPGERDLPRYDVQSSVTFVRTGVFSDKRFLRLGPVK